LFLLAKVCFDWYIPWFKIVYYFLQLLQTR